MKRKNIWHLKKRTWLNFDDGKKRQISRKTSNIKILITLKLLVQYFSNLCRIAYKEGKISLLTLMLNNGGQSSSVN